MAAGDALRLARPGADVCVPDDAPLEPALSRVTHVAVGAHADDLEIMAWHGIRAGLAGGPCFGGVVCTDGSGAPRAEAGGAAPDARSLRDVRRDEQRAAARRGHYAVAIQLDHPSAALQQGPAPEVVQDVTNVLRAMRARVVYTHSPADAHDTHVGVCVAALEAIRRLPEARRPEQVWGCEVWRGLDWAPAAQGLALGGEVDAWQALLHEFPSQNSARPYSIGAPARARANAVFRDSHEAGGHEPVWLALDLTPLTCDGAPDLADFVRTQLDALARDVLERLARVRGR